jgi:hypothetical protein
MVRNTEIADVVLVRNTESAGMADVLLVRNTESAGMADVLLVRNTESAGMADVLLVRNTESAGIADVLWMLRNAQVSARSFRIAPLAIEPTVKSRDTNISGKIWIY